MNSNIPLTLADRIALTLDLLCRAVAARVAGGGMAEGMILLVWRRVRRVDGQIRGLLARFLSGRLWRRVSGRSGGVGGRRLGAVARLPRGFGWLLPLVPGQAAGFAGQLRAALAEPEMVALLAASAQARRVLAPLCRMLGIEAAVLAPDAGLAGDGAGLVGEAVSAGAAAPAMVLQDRHTPRRPVDAFVERHEALAARLE